MSPAAKRSFRVGIDIGGTFTDIVAIDRDGDVRTKKVSSTPKDYSLGIAQGLSALLHEQQIAPDEIGDVVHATTVATNAILEGNGPKTALITTAGFRDVLEFRRVRVPELYNLDYVKPKPLVPRRWRMEVTERVGPDGAIRVPLDEESVHIAAQRLRDADITAVAICLLHSYANPMHERRIKEIVRSVLRAEVYVTCSHEVLPEIREYERTSTTVVNAFLGPIMGRYLGALRARLGDLGLRRALHVMTSGGGQMSVESALTKPAFLVESGPAAGVIAAARIAARAGLANVITLDMGGTTAKTAIIEDGQPTKTSEYEIGAGINLSSKLVKGAGYAIKLPFIDVSEIGAGGGSHIWFDKGGHLKIGPQSAGSEPGPVCYDRGGDQATLTDALLALGYINASALIGGALKLAPEMAVRAIEVQVCARLGKNLAEGAFGAVLVAVANMVRAVKSVSTYRGRDPRDYTLIAFGGNGPIVAALIAHELSMTRVLVPPHPGVLSAFGLLVADHERELVRSVPGLVTRLRSDALQRGYDELIAEAVTSLQAEGFERSAIVVRRFADLRYVGQAFELTVPVEGDAPPDLAALAAGFHREHLRTYAHMGESEPVELVNLRIIATVPTTQPVTSTARDRGGGNRGATQAAVAPARRQVYFGPRHGSLSTPIFARADLLGQHIAGPLIVEEYDSTCVVPPDCIATVDAASNLLLTLDT